MKSGENLARLSINVSHDFAFGNNTTALPMRFMSIAAAAKCEKT